MTGTLIVKSMERGVPRSHITREHGIARSVLSGWMRDFGSPAFHASKRGHLSQQEKRSIVRAIEEGRISNDWHLYLSRNDFDILFFKQKIKRNA